MFLNLPEIYIEVFVLVGVLSGLGVGLVLQPLEFVAARYCVEHLRTDVHQTHQR